MVVSLPEGDAWQQCDEMNLTRIVDCYCPNCEGSKGETLLLPTKIPGFREIIVAGMACPECHFCNSDVTFGGEIQSQGSILTLRVNTRDDLNRQILKSDYAILHFPDLNLEIPSTTERGVLTTVEGILIRTEENLSNLQPQRLQMGDLANFRRCQLVINNIRRIIKSNDSEGCTGEEEEFIFPFSLILDDASGNSYIENPNAPSPDSQIDTKFYGRTPTQDMSLGLQPTKAAVEKGVIDDSNPLRKSVVNSGIPRAVQVDDTIPKSAILRHEAMKFPTQCSNCKQPAEVAMCSTDIPHFKESIIMSMVCEHCGFRSNEIKGGGAIPEFGTRITLTVSTRDDLSRDVLKSDTAGVAIPELELELQEGGSGGVYTTVEGLLLKLKEQLERANPFGSGDAPLKQHRLNDGGEFSEASPNHARFRSLLHSLQELSEGNIVPFTVIISDPLANSFVGTLPQDTIALKQKANSELSRSCFSDANLKVEQFERSFEQNEMLGLNDIKVENDVVDALRLGIRNGQFN